VCSETTFSARIDDGSTEFPFMITSSEFLYYERIHCKSIDKALLLLQVGSSFPDHLTNEDDK